VSDELLDILKYALLALLYLFFARVLWAVWSEVRGPRARRGGGRTFVEVAPPQVVHVTHTDATAVATPSPVHVAAPAGPPIDHTATTAAPHRAIRGRRGEVGRLVVTQPKARRGASFALAEEITIGRAPSSTIAITDDTFISQLHARVVRRDGTVWVEDLGSTNGSFLNGRRLTEAEQIAKGDRLQFGNTVLEAE